MTNQKEKILLVEDDRVDRLAFDRHVGTFGFPYEFIIAESVKEAKHVLKSEKFDAAVIDYWLGDGTAFDLFSDIQDMPIVVVTGTGDEEIAVKAMKAGASDYISKTLKAITLRPCRQPSEMPLETGESKKN